MKLTGPEFERLHEALLDAFASYDELGTMLRTTDWTIKAIAAPDALPAVITKVIEYAEGQDKVADLIKAAQKQKPTNVKLSALDATQLEVDPTSEEVVTAGAGAQEFKDKLMEALGNLDTPGLQLVAAKEFSTLLDNASEEEADTLFLALLGNLKTDRPDNVLEELTPVLAAVLRRTRVEGAGGADEPLDLARARLRRIDLSGLDLHEADVAFADLRHANLANVNLWRSRGYSVDVTKAGLSRSNLEEARWHKAVAKGARFHDCRMVSVFLKDADLEKAEFQQSRLQGAHFDRANLAGASFEAANLADAYFRGAIIDEAAAESIARAVDWSQAIFDPEARALVKKHA